MTNLDEFLAKDGELKSLHSSMPLPQWVKDLTSGREKDDLIKDFVDGRLTALSVGNKEMLETFAAKYGFEYEAPKSNVLINNMDKNRGR